MLSNDQKRKAIIDGQSMVGQILNGVRVEMANAIADIGVKVVEEGWYDKSMGERLSDVRQTILENTDAAAHMMYEAGYEQGHRDALQSVYGNTEVQPNEIGGAERDEMEQS